MRPDSSTKRIVLLCRYASGTLDSPSILLNMFSTRWVPEHENRFLHVGKEFPWEGVSWKPQLCSNTATEDVDRYSHPLTVKYLCHIDICCIQ